MRKYWKRILAMLLVLMMVVPNNVTAFAAEDGQPEQTQQDATDSQTPAEPSEPEVYCEKCESSDHAVDAHCGKCGELDHAADAHCEVCGELDHTAEAHCVVCESLEHVAEAHCAVCGELDHAADAHCVKCDELGHVADDHCVDCDVFGHADKTSEDCEDYVIPCDNTEDCPAYIHEEGCPGEFVKCETDGCELVAGHPGECAGVGAYVEAINTADELWSENNPYIYNVDNLSIKNNTLYDFFDQNVHCENETIAFKYKKVSDADSDWTDVIKSLSNNEHTLEKDETYVVIRKWRYWTSSGFRDSDRKYFKVHLNRMESTVSLYEGKEIGYEGIALDENAILGQIFKSVNYGNEVITNNKTAVKIDKIEKYGNILGWQNTYKKIIDAAGQYRITVKYAGDDTYSASTATVEVTVVDGRLNTEIVLNQASIEMPTLDTRFTNKQILEAMGFEVLDENGNLVTNKTADVRVTVTGWNDGIASEINKAGLYLVTVTYESTTTHKGNVNAALLTVVDARIETKVVLKDGSLDMPTLDSKFNDSDVLNALKFNVTPDGALNVEDKSVEVIMNKPITEAGFYDVTVKYTANNTHKGSEATAKLTVNDTRKETSVNLKENQTIPYTLADAVTEEEAYDLVFESVTNVPDYIYSDNNVKITDGNENEITSDITAVGTYYITVKFDGNNTLKSSEATVPFTVTDGRNVTNVNMTIVDVAYDFADGLDKAEVLKALKVSVVDVTANETISDYTVLFKNGETEITPADMEVGGSYTIIVNFVGNEIQLPVTRTENFKVVDGRYETTLNLKENQTITYSEDTTPEDIFYLVFDSILGADNKKVTPVLKNTEDSDIMTLSNGNVNVTITVPDSLNVGMHTAKVEFLGDNNYKPSKAEVDFEVLKASTSLNINSATIKYSDMNGLYDAEELIVVNPNADYASFAVGFGLGNDASTDAGAIAYVDLPELIDLDSIKNEYIKGLIQDALDKIGNGTTMNIAELKSALETFLSTAEDAEAVLGLLGINLNLESINSLVSLLEQIEDLEGIGNLTIKLTMDKGLNISDSGVYLVGAVTSDANYETAYGLNYLIITPNGKKAELDWLIEDENGFVTIGAIASGEYDLGAYVSKVYEGTEVDAEKQLVELFLGVDAEGNPILTTEQSELTFGAYTEIAFIKDLGNEMYYAVPIVRPVVVVTDLVDVKFVDLNGNENYDRIFTYDGTKKAMLAEAYDRAGNKLDSANITYRYIGIESDVENYYSSDAPTEAGVYTVVAVYKEAGNTRVGMTVGAMVIQPAEAAVEVKDFVAVPYTEAPVDLVDTMEITTAPADAKVAIITGSVSAKGDFSEEGLDAVVGNLNIDLPERADEILEKLLGKDMETADITVKDLQRWVAELKTEISNLEDVEIDTAAFDELLEMLKDMPNVTSITFKDSIKPSAIGAYFVGAVVFDTNYIPNADAGILLITPEVENDELSWNYNDMNGIITLPALEEQDNLLAATAATGADVKYFIVGTDEYGKEVRIHTADISYDSLIKKGFGNGVYTQVAYIPFEADGNIAVGYPIVRSFVVAPQYVLIDFVPELNIETPVKFEYTGKPVDISTIVTYMDDTKVSEDKCNKYLTVRYVGVDSTGAEYNSTTAPTKEGVYTVTALYVERTEAGELIYAGLNVGLIEIIPASNNNNNQPEKPSGGSNKDDSKAELEGVYHPTSKTATKTAAMAKTGDSANVIGYACAVVAAGAALLYVFLKKKRA